MASDKLMKFSDFRKLTVWQKAMDLTEEVYGLIRLLPKEEMFSLSSQIRRAVVSVPSNIAEGVGRNSSKEFVQFLSIARGSLCELSTQLEICLRLRYLGDSATSKSFALIIEISKMLNSLSNSVLTPTETKNE